MSSKEVRLRDQHPTRALNQILPSTDFSIRSSLRLKVLRLLQRGNKRRAVEATAANETSSRSHALLKVTIKQQDNASGSNRFGKMFMVDLAGTERTSNTKVRLFGRVQCHQLPHLLVACRPDTLSGLRVCVIVTAVGNLLINVL